MFNKINLITSKHFILLPIFFFLSIGVQILFAQVKDSASSIKSTQLKPVSLIIPGSFILYGALRPAIAGIKNIDENLYNRVESHHPYFHTNAEDYIMWAPSVSIYMLDAFKVKTKHTFKEHTILEAGSIIITGGIGYAIRFITKPIPDYNTHNTQFPSGHTANAFRGAEIFHQELKDEHALLSYSGYVVAASVGVLRIYNKDHLLTQVLAGAGLGMLSTKLTYWIFNKVKYKKAPNKSGALNM